MLVILFIRVTAFSAVCSCKASFPYFTITGQCLTQEFPEWYNTSTMTSGDQCGGGWALKAIGINLAKI